MAAGAVRVHHAESREVVTQAPRRSKPSSRRPASRRPGRCAPAPAPARGAPRGPMSTTCRSRHDPRTGRAPRVRRRSACRRARRPNRSAPRWCRQAVVAGDLHEVPKGAAPSAAAPDAARRRVNRDARRAGLDPDVDAPRRDQPAVALDGESGRDQPPRPPDPRPVRAREGDDARAEVGIARIGDVRLHRPERPADGAVRRRPPVRVRAPRSPTRWSESIPVHDVMGCGAALRCSRRAACRREDPTKTRTGQRFRSIRRTGLRIARPIAAIMH